MKPLGRCLLLLLNFTQAQRVLRSSKWGIDSFWNLPHYPKIEYYRGQSLIMGQGKQLFEFVIPMFPQNWLRQDEIREYAEMLKVEKQPTALALSVLDVKQPAEWDGDPAITQHYCLAHYLLDGHHKTHAASELNKPITMLSFLAIDECMASEGDIQQVVDVLKLVRME